MTCFISRTLAPGSPFRTRLEAAGWQVRAFPLIELTALPASGALPACDWIFFSSRHAVDFFFAAYPSPPGVRWAAIGPGTAAALERHTGRVDFAGTGEPEAAAEAFSRQAAGQCVLFPGAAQSRQSIQQLLGDRIRSQTVIVYDNRARPDPPALPDDVLVFTSPLNVRAYFAHHSLLPHQRTVAIGRPTADTLRAQGIANVRLATAPTEEALARAVLDV